MRCGTRLRVGVMIWGLLGLFWSTVAVADPITDKIEKERKALGQLKDQIEEELAKVKDRIAELQNAINASKQMYAAACSRLGVQNDLDDDDGGES